MGKARPGTGSGREPVPSLLSPELPPQNNLPVTPLQPGPVLPSDLVSLEAGFHIEGGCLDIGYTVENRRSGDIWVLDIWETSPPQNFTPAVPQVQFEAPETAVVASWQDYPPPPPGTTWVSPPVFFGTQVVAGKQYRATMRLPLPLDARDSPGRAPGKGDVCRRVRLEIAVIPDWPEIYSMNVNGRYLGRFFRNAMDARRLLVSEYSTVHLPLVTGLLRS